MGEAARHELGATVTVRVTGSASDLPAVDWAADDAAARGVPLRLQYIEDAPRAPGMAASPDPDGVVAALSDRVHRRHADLVVRTRLTPLEPAPSPAGPRSLVVVGLSASQPLAHDDADSWLRRAAERDHCPVVIVRALPSHPHGPVVAGVEPHRAGAVLDFAFAHAERHRLSLRVVHAKAPSRRLNAFRIERSLDATSAGDAIDVDRMTNRRTLQFPTVLVDVREVHRRPLEALTRETIGASILVIGSPAGSRFRRRGQLGRVDQRALRNIPVVALAR